MVAIADKLGRPSIPTNYAVATTVKTARTAGVTVLETYDLSKFPLDTPAFFLTYKKVTDPTTGEVSVTNVTSWKALVNPDNNTLTNLTLAPGYVDTGNAIGDFVELIPTSFWGNSLVDALLVLLNPDGTPKASVLKTALGNDGRLVETLDELTTDVVSSGGIWTALTGFNVSMSALTAYIDGYRNTVSAIASRSFTPSKDTYVDVLRNTTTNAFSIVYTEVANGAATPALAPNSARVAIVVTSGAAVTAIRQSGYDGANNRVYPDSAVNPKQPHLFWEEIARGTLGSPAASLTVSSIPARKYLKILFYASDGINLGFRFNGDSGNNYSFRYSTSTGQSNAPGQSILGTMAGGSNGTFGEIEMINIAAVKKNGHLRGEWAAATAASVGDNSNFYFTWHNSSNQVSSITMLPTSGNVGANSEIIVLGHD